MAIVLKEYFMKVPDDEHKHPQPSWQESQALA